MDDIDIDWSIEEKAVDEETDPYSYVIADDPGGTTGIACLRYMENTPPELVYLHQQKDGQKGYLHFYGGSTKPANLVHVSESFTIREGIHGADVTPLRIEGIQYAIWQDDIVYQDPSMKSLVTDEWLKAQNLWTPGKRHQMDALIHAIVYLRNLGHKPTLRALGEPMPAGMGGEPGEEEEGYQKIKPLAEPGEAKSKELNEDGTGDSKPDSQKSEGEEAGEGSQHDENHGQGSYGGDGDHTHSDDYIPPDVKTPKKRREKNGVFAGWDVYNENDREVSLLDD